MFFLNSAFFVRAHLTTFDIATTWSKVKLVFGLDSSVMSLKMGVRKCLKFAPWVKQYCLLCVSWCQKSWFSRCSRLASTWWWFLPPQKSNDGPNHKQALSPCLWKRPFNGSTKGGIVWSLLCSSICCFTDVYWAHQTRAYWKEKALCGKPPVGFGHVWNNTDLTSYILVYYCTVLLLKIK